MSRSAQSQEPRRTIAKTTARGRPPVTSLRKVLSATRRAPIAPPAAPPQKIRPAAPKFGPTARPRHAAGRPRTAKARAVWQPHRAPPPTKIVLLVARRTPRTIAPPAAPPRKVRPAAPKFGPTARPRHAAGRPRTAKARAVWQPRRAPPRHENSPVSRTPRAAPPSPRPSHFRAQSGQPHKNWAAPDRTHRPSPAAKTIRQQRPRPKTRAPARTGGGAFPVCPFRSFLQHEPQRAIARTAPHDRQNNSARPSARHIAAQSPVSHTPRHAAPPAAPQKTLGPAAMPGAPPRPATKIVLLVARRTPRTIAPPAAPPRKVRPNTRPDAPRPKTRAPRPYGRGRVPCLSVSFLPPA